jgi:hypothetical protein
LVRTLPCSPRASLSVFLSSNRAASNVAPVRSVQMFTNCPTRPLVCLSPRYPLSLDRLASLLLCRYKDDREPRQRPSQLGSTSTPPARRCRHAARPQRAAAMPAYRAPMPFPASTPEPLPRLQRRFRFSRTPLAESDVYTDTYLGSVKGSRKRLRHVLLNSLDEVLGPLHPTDSFFLSSRADFRHETQIG